MSDAKIALGRLRDGGFEVFVVRPDNRIEHIWQDGWYGNWGDWEAMSADGKCIVVGQMSNGAFEVFIVGTDDQLYHSWQNGAYGDWSQFESMDHDAKEVAVGWLRDGGFEVFIVGTDDQIYHRWQNGQYGDWSEWETMSAAGKRIVLGRMSNGAFEVFIVGTDDQLHHSWQNGAYGDWSQFESMDHDAKEVAVGWLRDGGFEVFIVGTDDQIYHRWQNGQYGDWSEWETMSAAGKRIVLGRMSNGAFEVFIVGTDDQLHHSWQNGAYGDWSQFESMDHDAKEVAVGWLRDGGFEVFIVGTDDQIYHRWQNGQYGDWSEWEPLEPTVVNFDHKNSPFLWGVATASHQVEGGLKNSDWHQFTTSAHIKARVEGLGRLANTKLVIEPPTRAVDHWNLDVLAADLDRAKLLGMNAYRFSLEWSRIEHNRPAWADVWVQAYLDRWMEFDRRYDTGAPFSDEELSAIDSAPYDSADFDADAIGHYRQMVDLMINRGLEPILTLNHMSLPAWVLTPPEADSMYGARPDTGFGRSLRGWESPVTVKAFEHFVRAVVPHFRDVVRYWITLNEPVGSMIGAGYMGGVFPPGFTGKGARAKSVYFNLIDAHVRAYDVIKELAGTHAQVGFAHIVQFARPAPQEWVNAVTGGDNTAATSQFDYQFNKYFLDAVVNGDYNPEIWRKDALDHREEWAGKLDFIAPQYYRAVDIWHDKLIAFVAPWWGGNYQVDIRRSNDAYLEEYLWNDIGSTIHPEGLYEVLTDFHKRYALPILITENGISQSQDRNRAAYTVAHLQQVLRAIREGVNVIGYVHWTIVDNWEWAFGYQPDARFGLFTVDRSVEPPAPPATYPRHITEGATAFRYVIANSRRIADAASPENALDAAVARFGTISPDGLEVRPQVQAAGALWECRLDADDGPEFILQLSRLPRNGWVGMIFYQDTREWVPLNEIRWRPGADGSNTEAGLLTFWHAARHGGQGVVEYTARTLARGSGGPDRVLRGSLRDSRATERVWVARRDPRVGIWKNTGVGLPSFIAVNRFEGDYDRWHAKYLYLKKQWQPDDTAVDWDGNRVRIVAITEMKRPNPPLDMIEGTLDGDKLYATITIAQTIPTIVEGFGSETALAVRTDWVGERLADDIPFY